MSLNSGYFDLTNSEVQTLDQFNTNKIGTLLQKMKRINVFENITAGASGATITKYVFKTPVKMNITGFTFVVDTPSVGLGNTPNVQLKNGTVVLADTGAIALSGAAGDVHEGVLNIVSANLVVAMGTVLTVLVINTAGTITTAIIGRPQIEWQAVV